MKKSVHIEGAPKPIGPYSQAIISHQFMFVSGQIPLNPHTGELVAGDIAVQTRQVMENIKELLQSAGLGFENVVKVSIFLTDLSHFKTVNEIYGSYFKEDPPARETIQVAALPMGVDIEISLIAAVNPA